MIYSYSKSISSPLHALNALRASNDGARPDYTHGANDTAVTARAHGTAAVTRQHSQQNLRAHSQAHAPRDQPHVLSNGQQVHKVPYYRPTVSSQGGSTKHTNNVALDGVLETPKMSIIKTGRKSFTLGGPIVPAIAKSKATPAPAVRHNVTKSSNDKQSVIPSVSSLSCDTLDEWKEEFHGRQDQTSRTSTASDHSTHRWNQPAEAFVNRSLFYTLSDAETLLRSFHDSNEAFQFSPLPHLDSARLTHSFRDWSQRSGALIFDSLSVALEALYTRPPTIEPQVATEAESLQCDHSAAGPTGKPGPTACPRYLNNHEAAHIVMICIHALTSSVPVGWPRTWTQLRSLRSWGIIIPSATADADDFVDPYINIIDALEYEPAVMLADCLLRAIGVRSSFDHIHAAMHKEAGKVGSDYAAPEESLSDILIHHLIVVERVALESKRKMKSVNTANKEPGWTITATLVEWLKTIITKKWDGNIEIRKWSNVGAAIMLLHELRKSTHPSLLTSQH